MLYDKELLACSQYAILTCVVRKILRVSILSSSYTHCDGGEQQKHNKMTNNRLSERPIETTSSQTQDNDTSIERYCFENNNR